jgi:hypothetical protein
MKCLVFNYVPNSRKYIYFVNFIYYLMLLYNYTSRTYVVLLDYQHQTI